MAIICNFLKNTAQDVVFFIVRLSLSCMLVKQIPRRNLKNARGEIRSIYIFIDILFLKRYHCPHLIHKKVAKIHKVRIIY